MDGKTTNVPSGASNKKKPVPTTQGRKELKTKNNVDIAEDLENFTGREGYVVVANYGMAEFIHNTVKEAENANQMSMQAAMSKNQVVPTVTGDTVKAATLIVTTLPILMVYPFLQKYFIKGINIGAVKG